MNGSDGPASSLQLIFVKKFGFLPRIHEVCIRFNHLVKPFGQMDTDQSTQERIIHAAKQVFFEKGMSGARMQDIADRAGINKALLHYYFRNKEKLFFLIFQEAVQSFLPQIQSIFKSTPDMNTMIRGFVQSYLTMLHRQPYLAAFIIQEINRNPRALWDALNSSGSAPFPIQAFEKFVTREVEAGHIRPIDPFQLWAHIMGLCIFPYLGRPLMKMVFQYSEPEFDQFLVDRQEEVIQLLTTSLKPQ